MLEVLKLTKSFGGLIALRNVEFTIDKGSLVGLIGPNGAGKTTLFNCITGVYRPSSGKIKFEGKDITGLKPHQICKLGIARTYQLVKPFSGMTVLENVKVGAAFGCETGSSQEPIDCLKLVGLGHKKDVLAANLTLPEKKMLEIARALATNPKLLLLDEVAAGLNPVEAEKIMHTIKKIRDEMGITIIWIEHVMNVIMRAAERVIVLHHGEKIADAPPEEIIRNERVVKAYLGEAYSHIGR